MAGACPTRVLQAATCVTKRPPLNHAQLSPFRSRVHRSPDLVLLLINPRSLSGRSVFAWVSLPFPGSCFCSFASSAADCLQQRIDHSEVKPFRYAGDC
jgi:hypothetical protein